MLSESFISTRYALLSMLLTFRTISAKVAKKYRTFQSLVEVGLLTEQEKERLEDMKRRTEDQYTIHWYPIQWAQTVLRRCYSDGHLGSDLLYDRLHQELLNISARNGTLLREGSISFYSVI